MSESWNSLLTYSQRKKNPPLKNPVPLCVVLAFMLQGGSLKEAPSSVPRKKKGKGGWEAIKRKALLYTAGGPVYRCVGLRGTWQDCGSQPFRCASSWTLNDSSGHLVMVVSLIWGRDAIFLSPRM